MLPVPRTLKVVQASLRNGGKAADKGPITQSSFTPECWTHEDSVLCPLDSQVWVATASEQEHRGCLVALVNMLCHTQCGDLTNNTH